MEAAIAGPFSGPSSDPVYAWLLLLYRDPRTERMTIAKTEITTQDQAFKAETTGFMVAV
jgi:hypothetical protein